LPQVERALEITRIQLCGRLSVEIDGVQLSERLRGKQVPLLLAYLVLHRARHVGRDELIDALWPDQPPVSQDAALRTLLSRLRSSLGASTLAGRDELILTLPEPVWIDVEAAAAEVARAVDALEGGDARRAWALAQVPLNIASRGLLPGSQATWLEPPRRELEAVRQQALEVIGRAGLVMGGTQLQSAERAARTLIETQPYRESGYVLLMEALAARGDVAEAMRVFDGLRTLLRDELGTAPSPEAIVAHERLLRPEPRTGEPGGRSDQGASSIPLPAELRHRARAQLIGREQEIGELEERWDLACGGVGGGRSGGRDGGRDGGLDGRLDGGLDGRRDGGPAGGLEGGLEGGREGGADPEARSGRIVLLAGDAGIGKTTLTAELARRVHDAGAIVLAGRSPRETVVPYQPFLEALRHWAMNAVLTDLRANTREYGSELARLIPELRRRAPDLPPPPQDEPETERYRLFEAVVGLLTELSRSAPVLLVLDDLQWADRPTLLLLRHMARATNPARLLILGAYRAADRRGDTFTNALGELRRDRLASQLDIRGLSESETAELVLLRAGENPARAFARALYEETEGNPFFVEEIIRHLIEAGVEVGRASASELQRFGLPEGVKQVIAFRLGRLEAPAAELLRVAAVIGRDIDATLLERVVLLSEEEFLGALDEALAAELLVESDAKPGSYLFSHALIRETLYESMSGPRRARIHKRVGEAIEAMQGRRRERYLPELAYHFTRGADPEDAQKAITYAVRAGEQATTMLAHEEAAEHYARAIDVQGRFQPEASERRCELLLRLGEARVRAGERALGSSAFREAAALAERLGDGASLARAAIGASRRYVQPPGVVDTELIAMIERALELEPDRSLVRVRLLACLCGAIYYSPERDRMRALSDEAIEIATELGDPEARAYACSARRRILWDAPHLSERVEVSTEMLTLARQIGNLELQLQAHAWLVVDLLERGDRDAVTAQMEAFDGGASRLRESLYEWSTIVWRAMSALLAGQLERADVLASEALAAGAPAEAVTASQYYSIQVLGIRREQGRMGELEHAARKLVDDNPGRPAWRAALATLLCEEGRLDEAREEFERLAAGGFDDVPKDLDWLIAMTLLSDVCADLGDGERAALLYAKLGPYAAVNVVIGLAAVCLGSAESFLGKLAATMGDGARAERHFERALEANAQLGARACLARTQVDYARALGSGPRAAELIAAASATAAELGLGAVTRKVAKLERVG
jgi:predicted ATPase/DNA-binding SARP family transcriptional activator/tetratricopeptide (TPR) repeat protein